MGILLKILLAALLLFVVVIVIRINQTTQSPSKKELPIGHDSTCNLQLDACPFFYEGDEGIVSINPRPFYLNRKITVNMTFREARPRRLELDLKGLDMDMGYIHYTFQTDDDKTYQVEMTLPTCTKDYMSWQMALIKKYGKEEVNLFKFVSEKEK